MYNPLPAILANTECATALWLNMCLRMAECSVQGHETSTPILRRAETDAQLYQSRLHGYTVHQQYPALYFPNNAHNVKNLRVIKTF